MMRAALLTLLLLAIPARAADPWTEQDTVRQVAVTGLLYVDYHQTKMARDFRSPTKMYHEQNPILPMNHVGAYFVTATVGHALIARELSATNRARWQWAVIALESVIVVRNKRIGLNFVF